MSVTFYPGYLDGNCWTFVAEARGLNTSNANARDIAHAVGLFMDDEGLVAATPIVEVERRCIRFLQTRVGNPDPCVPTIVEHGAGGATMIDCGRGAGYLQNRVSQLLHMARAGREYGATHVYGA